MVPDVVGSNPIVRPKITKKTFVIFSKLSLDEANKPRQNFPESFTANGYLDIIKSENIFKNKYLSKKCFAFKIPQTIDIDSEIDLLFARLIKNQLK